MEKTQVGDLEAGHPMWLFEECIWFSLWVSELAGMQNGEAASHPLSPYHSGLIATETVSRFSR